MADVQNGVILGALFSLFTGLCLLDCVLSTLTWMISACVTETWSVVTTVYYTCNFDYVTELLLSGLLAVFHAVFTVPFNLFLSACNFVLLTISVILSIPLWLCSLVFYSVYFVVCCALSAVISFGYAVLLLVAFIVGCAVLFLIFAVLFLIGIKVYSAIVVDNVTWAEFVEDIDTAVSNFIKDIKQLGIIQFSKNFATNLRPKLQRLFANMSNSGANMGRGNDVRDVRDVGGGDETESDNSSCIICYDRPRDTVIFPCGHAQFCDICAQIVSNNTRKCPTCNGPINEIRRIFT